MRYSPIAAALALLLLLSPAPARAADKPDLWLYYSSNLLVDDNLADLQKVWQRAAAAGYTHVLLTDSKFARLSSMDKHYFDNVEKVKKIAADLKLQIVPALFDIGYSNDLLSNDPNLAEGLPVRDALFVVHKGEAKLVPDPAVDLATMKSKDDVVKINGNVATITDNPANARMIWALNVSPFRCYHVSFWLKTDHYTGTPQVEALVDGTHNLQYQSLAVKSTQDWTRYDVVFYSLDHKQVNLYLGVWGNAAGTLQWKDWAIEEAGLVNVLRRPGTPLVVKGYIEDRDYEPIKDPLLGNDPYLGEYTSWHEVPSIHTKLPEGTALRVSWYAPAIINDGQVSLCFNEPSAKILLAEQARQMRTLFNTTSYMMQHDEIRVMGWDESASGLHEDAGPMLADNAKFCVSLLHGADVYVWSDMFDPFHNAHANYYLVNGDLAGSWNGLDKSVVIVNWNFDKRDQSLKFFADRGHHQIIAGYYDGDVKQVREWLASATRVTGVSGVMYTTWKHNYADLEAFAKEVKGG